MGKSSKSRPLDLSKRSVPHNLTELYEALLVANGDALMNALGGESKWEREWRLASRLCRQFLAATEEMAQLALTSQLGDWEEARTCKERPADEYTYHLWLAAQAWRLLDFSRSGADERDDEYIDTVRHAAREGIIAVKTAPTLGRTMAYQALRTEHKIDDRVRGPELEPSGSAPSFRIGEDG